MRPQTIYTVLIVCAIALLVWAVAVTAALIAAHLADPG